MEEVAGTRSESARDITQSKNGQNNAHLRIIKSQSTEFQINPTKDGVVGTRFRWDGRTDRWKDGKTDAHTNGQRSFLQFSLRLRRMTKIVGTDIHCFL